MFNWICDYRESLSRLPRLSRVSKVKQEKILVLKGSCSPGRGQSIFYEIEYQTKYLFVNFIFSFWILPFYVLAFNISLWLSECLFDAFLFILFLKYVCQSRNEKFQILIIVCVILLGLCQNNGPCVSQMYDWLKHWKPGDLLHISLTLSGSHF